VPPTSSAAATAQPAVLADRLFAAHSPALLRYCRKLLGSAPEAEDAVQTTFLYATRALQRGVVPESESAWLHTIAKNVCRWQWRTSSRQASVACDPLEGPLASEPAPEHDEDLPAELRATLALLPDRQRHALVLREVHGLTAREVGEALGLRPGETYALLSRARRSFVNAYKAVTGRTSLGVQVGPLLLKLKAALSGGVATVVAATSLGGGVVVGVSGAQEEGGPTPRRTTPAVESRFSRTVARVPIVGSWTPTPVESRRAAFGMSKPKPALGTATRNRNRPTAARPEVTTAVALPDVGTHTRPGSDAPAGDTPDQTADTPTRPAPPHEPKPEPKLPVEPPALPTTGELLDPLDPVTPDPLPDADDLLEPVTGALPDEPPVPLPSVPGAPPVGLP
jgi:RNA polymerase sigma factor (sigma-70 family)